VLLAHTPTTNKCSNLALRQSTCLQLQILPWPNRKVIWDHNSAESYELDAT
jgi:hypothetical protein